MKLLDQEQYNQMQADLSAAIGKIEEIQNEFDVKGLKQDIVNEFKDSLSKNSLFESLKQEDLELKKNLIMLKDVRREFIICKNIRDWKIFFFTFFSVFWGAGSVWILFKFGFIS